MLVISNNCKIFLHALLSFFAVYKKINPDYKSCLKISPDQFIYFAVNCRNSTLIKQLNDYIKTKKMLGIKWKIYNLKKKQSKFKELKKSHLLNNELNCYLTIKQNLKGFEKNKILIRNFHAFSVFFSKKNLENKISIQFFDLAQIKYFLLSLCDEIIFSGKIKFISNNSALFNPAFLKKTHIDYSDEKIKINCRKIEKTKYFSNRTYLFLSQHRLSKNNLSSLSGVFSKFFFLKKIKKLSKRFETDYVVKSKKILYYIFNGAFSFTDLDG